MKFKTLAAIDIGSNAIRFLINNVERNGDEIEFRKIAYLRVPIRLGEDTFTKGIIDKGKANRLNEAMSAFSHLMKAYKVSSYGACATSAMRDAKNGQEIVKNIQKNSGIDIQIITGNEEASLIFEAGGLSSGLDHDKNYIYVDVGGGSTEIIFYSRHEKKESKSFQVGTVRVLAKVVTKEECDKMEIWLKNNHEKYTPLSIIASGGNINKAYKLLSKQEREPMSYVELKMLYDSLASMSFEERIENFKLNPYRADVIIPALDIFLTIGRICNVKEIFVPKVGVADGIIHRIYNTQFKGKI